MIAFFDYCRLLSHRHPAYHLAWHVPNERKASVQRRVTMARAGVKKGVPDISVPVPNKTHHGLYIELKIKPNKPSPEQLKIIDELNKVGNYACVCWSAEEAIATLEAYLADKL